MRVDHAYDWPRRHPRLVDAALVGALLIVLALPMAITRWSYGWLAVAQVVPLFWRRTRPALAFAGVALGCALQVVATDSPLATNVALPVAVYSIAAYQDSRRLSLAGLATGWLGAVMAGWDWTKPLQSSPRPASISYVDIAVATVTLGGLVTICWIGGDLMRHRRAVAARLVEQNLALERDQAQREQLAAQAERNRIAREMHDVLAHNLSVIVVQADGAAYTAGLDPIAAAENSERTLQTIAQTAREALAETRRLVAVLRASGDDVEYAPTASIGEIESLVARLAEGGRDVHLHLHGAARPLHREVELAAVRIVQESLTNVIKHAGPAAAATVRLSYLDHHLQVRIDDDGMGTAALDTKGSGVAGMRERAAAVGGSLHAGPRPEGGYTVVARLPADAVGESR